MRFALPAAILITASAVTAAGAEAQRESAITINRG